MAESQRQLNDLLKPLQRGRTNSMGDSLIEQFAHAVVLQNWVSS
ncbi:MAG: hypothetical protein ACFB8W_05225 [Elainellaceae cyanobacterium]